MKFPKIFSLFFILSVLILTGCGKDDDSSDEKTPDGAPVSLITGEEGCNLEIKTNGVAETCIGTKVFGWNNGNLMNSRRFEQLRTGCDGNNFVFRISMPPGTVFQDAAVGEHSLYANRLLLQNTGNLDVIYTEFYDNSPEPGDEELVNATGTITIRKDVVALGTTYAIVGDIDASINNNGSIKTIKGQFWSKTIEW